MAWHLCKGVIGDGMGRRKTIISKNSERRKKGREEHSLRIIHGTSTLLFSQDEEGLSNAPMKISFSSSPCRS
jgi:hypothetical protein